MAFSTSSRWRLNFARKAANGSAASAARMKGMPSPGRVDREQHRAARHRILRGRDGEDRSEDWADARRPSKRKGKTHHVGAPEPDRMGHAGGRFSRSRMSRRVSPRKCSPMTGMMMPATMPSSADHA